MSDARMVLGGGSEFFVIVALLMILLAVMVHIAFTVGVWADSRGFSHPRDANRRYGEGGFHERPKLVLVGHVGWILATLLGGVLVAAVYWVLHHSTLRPATAPATELPGT